MAMDDWKEARKGNGDRFYCNAHGLTLVVMRSFWRDDPQQYVWAAFGSKRNPGGSQLTGWTAAASKELAMAAASDWAERRLNDQTRRQLDG